MCYYLQKFPINYSICYRNSEGVRITSNYRVKQGFMEEESGCWAGFQRAQQRRPEWGKENAIQGQRAVSRTFHLKCEFEEDK